MRRIAIFAALFIVLAIAAPGQGPSALQVCVDQARAAGTPQSACFRVAPTSILRGAAPGGRDVGANIDVIVLVEQCAISGDSRHPACIELQRQTGVVLQPPRNLRIVR